MNVSWMGKYRIFVEKLVKFGNAYAQHYNTEKIFNTPVPLSSLQIQVLEYILENEEKNQKMTDIAARLGISPSTFTKHVKRMVDRGLLEKYHIEGNRKEIIVKASENGIKLYGMYSDYIHREVFQPIFQELDDLDDQTLAKFEKILELACKMGGETVKKEEKTQTVKLIRLE